jgi:hypothetical protein
MAMDADRVKRSAASIGCLLIHGHPLSRQQQLYSRKVIVDASGAERVLPTFAIDWIWVRTLLLQCDGVDVNPRALVGGANGITPLYTASFKNHPKTVYGRGEDAAGTQWCCCRPIAR